MTDNRHVCPECGCECRALVEELDALQVALRGLLRVASEAEIVASEYWYGDDLRAALAGVGIKVERPA